MFPPDGFPIRVPIRFLVPAFAAALAAFAAEPVLRYEESFANTSGKPRNIDVAAYGWASYLGESGALNRSGTSIGAGPGHPSDSPGYLASANAPGASRILTKAINPGVNIGEGVEVEFRFGASNERVETRFLVCVDQEWFATAAVFTGTTRLQNGAAFAAASDAEVLRRVSLAPDRRVWRRVRIELDSVSVVDLDGSPVSLPAGKPITGVGFHLANQHRGWGSSAYFDTIRLSTR